MHDVEAHGCRQHAVPQGKLWAGHLSHAQITRLERALQTRADVSDLMSTQESSQPRCINSLSSATLQEKLRARHLSPAQITRLEEAWKARPETKVEDLDAPGEDEEAAPVALRYEVGIRPAAHRT